MKVLAWRFDHVGDCNRYGNCTDHPYFELPRREELVPYPETLPGGSVGLEYVPLDALSNAEGATSESTGAFEHLRRHSETLRASIGEALHSIQRGRIQEVESILENASLDFDRVWNFRTAEPHPAIERRD